MKGIHTLVLLATLLGAQAFAQEDTPEISATTVETWSCYDQMDYSQKSPLVTLYRHKWTDLKTEESVETGNVEVAGVVYTSSFDVHGFDRRWDFGPDDAPASYAFIIHPSGDGLYYDFSNSDKEVKPSQFFDCVMK